ncbi:MAG TPA: methyl-accepting chemotaxis protein [Cellvibrionaceae bacterium]
MRTLFNPALTLANALSFNNKLAMLVMMFLIPFLALGGEKLLRAVDGAEQANIQAQGLEWVNALKPLLVKIAQHRGLSAQALNGGASDAIIPLEKAIDADIQTVKHLQQSSNLKQSGVEAVEKHFDALRFNHLTGTPSAQSFKLHSAAILEIQNIIAVIADDFQLLTHNELSSRYSSDLSLFILPALVEEIGKLRGKGAGALADNTLTDFERVEIMSLKGATDHLRAAFSLNVEQLNQDAANKSVTQAAFDAAQKSLLQFLDSTDEQFGEKAPSLKAPQYFELGTRAIGNILELDSIIARIFSASVDEQLARSRLTCIWLIALLTGITLLGVYCAVGILISITQNTRELSQAATNMCSGDFAFRLKVRSKDTLGATAEHLNLTVHQVALLIQQIQTAAQEVNQSTIAVQQGADTSRAEISQQSLQTQQSASAATEMAATVREVASNCSHATQATYSTRQNVSQGQTKVQDAVTNIVQLGHQVDEAKIIITDLQSDVTAIGKVLEVIRSIAEQTNLLALNAAIEAARAGEQGRGFAVVADEVRSLAKRTQESTAEIRSVIEKLQKRAALALDIINQSHISAKNSIDSTTAAGDTLNTIVRDIELLDDLNRHIAAAAAQQAIAAEQLSKSTNILSQSADTILQQIHNTTRYSQQLHGNAKNLMDTILRFKISTN